MLRRIFVVLLPSRYDSKGAPGILLVSVSKKVRTRQKETWPWRYFFRDQNSCERVLDCWWRCGGEREILDRAFRASNESKYRLFLVIIRNGLLVRNLISRANSFDTETSFFSLYAKLNLTSNWWRYFPISVISIQEFWNEKSFKCRPLNSGPRIRVWLFLEIKIVILDRIDRIVTQTKLWKGSSIF